MIWTLAALLACSGGGETDACLDADADGVCDAADLCPGYDDAEDVDGDGTPDPCQRDPLGGFEMLGISLPPATETVEAQLAYDTTGAVSTWKIFEPPLVLTETDPGVAETRTLTGWQGVEDHLVDDTLEAVTLRLRGVEDDARWTHDYEEADLEGLGELRGVADVREVRVEAIHWEPFASGLSLTLEWSFNGVP